MSKIFEVLYYFGRFLSHLHLHPAEYQCRNIDARIMHVDGTYNIIDLDCKGCATHPPIYMYINIIHFNVSLSKELLLIIGNTDSSIYDSKCNKVSPACSNYYSIHGKVLNSYNA